MDKAQRRAAGIVFGAQRPAAADAGAGLRPIGEEPVAVHDRDQGTAAADAVAETEAAAVGRRRARRKGMVAERRAGIGEGPDQRPGDIGAQW